jgi:ABC-type nickel/cobalt efflux system permease component RcnA
MPTNLFPKCLVVLLAILLFASRPGFAHPMGNFSVNHYSKITLGPNDIRLDYFIDLAEIPTYQELQQYSLTPGDPAAIASFLAIRATELGGALTLRIDGTPLVLHLVSSGVIFPPGAGGLPTMKMGYVFQANYPARRAPLRAAQLTYSDDNYPGHAGWKEIIADGPSGMLLASSVPSTDRSAGLTNYPTDMLHTPPQDLSATISFLPPILPVKHPNATTGTTSRLPVKAAMTASPGVLSLHSNQPVPGAAFLTPHAVLPEVRPAPMRLQANRQGTAHNAFTELVTTRHLSLWFLLTAALIAIGLGALHALEPGHGKTIVAAYLVGSRGTAGHAVLLGVVVTAAHTASVFALGAITLYASRYLLPEQLYPWLGVLSGLTIAGLGSYMLLRRWTGEDMDHAHDAGAMHGHWFSSRKRENAEPRPVIPTKAISLSQLVVLGITGGMIPCPAALVVLLSAFALHRVGFGFFLITSFSVGLASVLIGFGLLMVYARQFMSRLQMDGPLTRRWLPVASAAFMTVLGVTIAIRAFVMTGLTVHSFSQRSLGPVLFIAGLGLILGIRHSTDADHVVAISTIVTRQRSLRGAALIGTIWGLGHTLTIFVVGCMIILFGVVIPPRIGLSMEFSVALMLILLGVLNLTGVMRKIVARFAPDRNTSSLFTTEIDSSSGNPLRRYATYQYLRPLAIGLVHGLAGSAAIALLVLSTIHTPLWAILYLVIFGAGTMLGMMGMTAAMSLPMVYAGDRLPRVGRYLGIASGLVSVCFGGFLVYQLGYLGGLFTSHPQWTPR